MKRWSLVLLLAVGILSAGFGTALVLGSTPLGAASFGWTAYSPLSSTSYWPGNVTGLFWTSKIAAALLALGAGLVGASGTALVLTRIKHAEP